MKVIKRGDYLVAIAEQGDNEGRSKKSESLGKISIKSGNFTGNTCCSNFLHKELEKFFKEQPQLEIRITGGGTKEQIIKALRNLALSIEVSFETKSKLEFEDETLMTVLTTEA